MFLLNILMMIALLASATIIGRVICLCLPFKLRPSGKFFLSPSLGLAFLVLLATLFGWRTGFPESLHAGLITLSFTLGAFYFEKQKKALFVHLGVVLSFSVLASVALMSILLRFDSYNTFNDAFTYLVHSQWLQAHSFSERFQTSGFHPALSQVALYQALGCRMGASFFLGWMQSILGTQWSYMVYPAAVTLPLVTCSLAVGYGTCLLGLCRRWYGLVIGLVMATGLGGVPFATLLGFLPQAYGMAFAISYLCLIGAMLTISGKTQSWRGTLLLTIPAALLFCAMVYSYSEIAPFVTIASLVSGGVLFVRFDAHNRKKLIMICVSFLLYCVVLLNSELPRAIRSIISQSGAIVGGPINWSICDFLGHVFGLHAGAWDADAWFFNSKPVSIGLLFVILGSFVPLAKKLCSKKAYALIPCASYILVSIIAFCLFRYAVTSPWPVGVGQSWSQFKVSQWVQPFCFVFLSVAISFAFNQYRNLISVVLLIIISTGLLQNFYLASFRTNAFRKETGYEKSSFKCFLDIRHVVKTSLTENNNIYLDLGGHHHKIRQMLAYFLLDQKLSGDWSDDGYLYPWLPPEQQNIFPASSSHMISFVGGNQMQTLPSRSAYYQSGNLIMMKTPSFFVKLPSVSGGYEKETEGSDWRYWTRNSLEFYFDFYGNYLPKKVNVRFTYLSTTAKTIFVSLRCGGIVRDISLKPQNGWNSFLIENIAVGGASMVINMKSYEKSAPISKTDTREVSFLIQNLCILPQA